MREEEDEIDDEEEDDGGFEPEHEPVVAVLLEEFVEAVERAEFFVDGAVPVAQVEDAGSILVDAGEVPFAEELGGVGEFVAEAGEVDAEFAQLGEDGGRAALVGGEVAAGLVEGGVEEGIVGFEFLELDIGEFDDVEGFGEVVGFVDEEGAVPVGDDEVVAVVAEAAAGGFGDFLIGEEVGMGFCVEEGGDLALVSGEPAGGIGGDAGGVGVKAEDGVRFAFREGWVWADGVGGEFGAGFFEDGAGAGEGG